MIKPLPIINIESEEGKTFISKARELRDSVFSEHPIHNKEKVRQFQQLSNRKIKKNNFLKSILDTVSEQAKPMFDALKLKRIYLGNFARKASSLFQPVQKEDFRILIHFGDTEVYYLDNENTSGEPIILREGEGIILPPSVSANTSISVYPDPIRILNDPELQTKLPKIRPRNYNRINLIYDYELDLSFIEKELIENKEKSDD